MINKILFPLLILILFSSCSNDTVIQEDVFIKVYVDLMILRDTTSSGQISIDSMKTIIFNRYGITPEQYEQTIAYYNSSPAEWEKFFDKAIAYTEKLKAKSDRGDNSLD